MFNFTLMAFVNGKNEVLFLPFFCPTVNYTEPDLIALDRIRLAPNNKPVLLFKKTNFNNNVYNIKSPLLQSIPN